MPQSLCRIRFCSQLAVTSPPLPSPTHSLQGYKARPYLRIENNNFSKYYFEAEQLCVTKRVKLLRKLKHRWKKVHPFVFSHFAFDWRSSYENTLTFHMNSDLYIILLTPQ